MVTLRDVARAAGVHPTTASSVLNGSAGNSRFGEETRRAVHRAAKRLGYAQNRIASSLRTKRTGTVGLVAGNIQNPFFAALSLQLEMALKAAGYELLLTCHGADAAQDEADLARTLLARSVDGLLIWSEYRGQRTPRLPKAASTPRVWMGYAPPREPAVTIDIAAGLALALTHLQELGCRRLAYYAPASSQNSGLPQSRLALLDEACRQRGLPPPLRLLFPEESWNLDAAVRHATASAETAARAGVDGVIGYNDVSAVGWQIAAREQGRSWPVVGFDGSPLVRAWRPRISFVDLHIGELAQRAAEILCGLLAGQQSGSRRAVVHPRLVRSGDPLS